MVNFLIEKGADLTAKNDIGLSAIEALVRYDNADLLECIYPNVKEYEQRKNKQLNQSTGNYSLLHLAAGNGNSKCLNFIISKMTEEKMTMADQLAEYSNSVDKASPLHFAMLADNEENVKTICRILKKKNKTSLIDS